MKIDKLRNLLPKEQLDTMALQTWATWNFVWDYWPLFIESFLRNNKSLKTIESVHQILRFFLRKTKLWTMESWWDAFEPENEFHRLKEENKWSNTTYRTYRKNMSCYFWFLKTKRIIPENYINTVWKPAAEIKEQRVFTKDEITRLLVFLQRDTEVHPIERLRNELYFRFALHTGARPIELVKINIYSFSGEGREILNISGAKQMGSRRPYGLSIELRTLLSQYIKAVNISGRAQELERHIFVSIAKKWWWLTENGINKLCQRISKRIGFRINTYQFRRYVATSLYDKGVEVSRIAKYLWHRSIKMTLRYIQTNNQTNSLCSGIMEDEAESMNSLLNTDFNASIDVTDVLSDGEDIFPGVNWEDVSL